MRTTFKVLVGVLPFATAGCENGLFGIPNPKTQFRYDQNGAYFSDTKDNDVQVKGLKAEKGEDGTFKGEVEELKILNNASQVRQASVDQMLVLVQQQMAFNEGIRAVGEVVEKLVPIVGQITAMLQANRVSSTGFTLPGGYGGTISRGSAPPAPVSAPAPSVEVSDAEARLAQLLTDLQKSVDDLQAKVSRLEAVKPPDTQPE